MSVLLTTTGTLGTVVIDDLGGRSFVHPVTDYELTSEYTYDEIRGSADLGAALDNGYISIENDGNPVGDSSTLMDVQPQVGDGGVVGGGSTSPTVIIINGSSRSGAYETVGSRWLYGGTGGGFSISQVRAIGYKDSGGSTTMDIRILDVTNGNVICEITGQDDQDPTIYNLGAISNLPVGEAILECQVKRNNNPISRDCFTDSLLINYSAT